MGWLSAILCPERKRYTTRGEAASTLNGFGPQSGLAQRGGGVLYAAFGVRETMVFCEESAGSCIPEG